MSKVKFMGGSLRKPALKQMAFGYGEWVTVIRVDIDDIVGLDFPDTEQYCGILAHGEVTGG